MSRTWVRDDHHSRWALYEVPDGAAPGLADLEGTLITSVADELLRSPTTITMVEERLAEVGAPPMPDGAWPAREAREASVRYAVERLKEFLWIELHPADDDGQYDRLARVALGLDIAHTDEHLST